MRIALGGIYQESHSFSPAPATLDQFVAGHLLRGEEVVDRLKGINHEVGGALEAATGHEIVPLLHASTVSSGQPIRRAVYDALFRELLDRLQAALPVDGVFLAMHGAMVAEHYDDATGHLLKAVREVTGNGFPIVATLDLHANVTREMVAMADALVGYHTYPHIDQGDTGRRGMSLLLDIAAGNIKPEMALRQIPMVLPPENGQTTTGPYSEVMQQVMGLEQDPNISAASVYHVQPWLDLPEMGCSVVVVANRGADRAQAEADRLAVEFWRRREAFVPELVPAQEAIDRALADDRCPFVFSDSADSTTSGAPGDSTVLLKVLLDRKVRETALLNIVDPRAVAAAIDAGVGETVELTVGATFSRTFYEPVTFTGVVKALSDGRFRHKGPGFKGSEFQMGRTAVVVSGGIHLVIMEQTVFQWDPELYRSQGLEPVDAKIVAVKSPAAFRAAFAPIAAEILVLELPGVSSPDLQSFSWERITHPMFPFEDLEDETWL